MSGTERDPLESVRRVIIVSNVLPVQMSKNPRTNKWSVEFDTNPFFEDGPLLAGLASCTQNAIFVGVPPVNVPAKEREEVEQVLARKNCYPVFVSAKEASLHYQGMCKSVLWPLFHSIIDLYSEVQIETVSQKADLSRPQTPQTSQEESGSWHPARSFNPQEIEFLWPAHLEFLLKFRSVILSLYSDGDVVWVHDYHLIMLVGPLRRLLPPSAPIGIFLHTPFPSSEIFRCLSKRNEILESLLQADHVGFHSYEYARHFLTCAQRMLGYAYGAQRGGVFGIRTGKGRTVTLTTAHAGLDLKTVSDTLAAGLPKLSIFPPPKPGVKVVCGVDEVEGLRGISLKLLAFDRMLVNCPALRGRVVLRQIGINLDSRPHDFKRCVDEVNRLVAQLNDKWGNATVMFEIVTSFPLGSRLAFYADSDIILQSCVRWGLSVDALEFVIANKVRAKEAAKYVDDSIQAPPRGPGVVVCSEFVSCSRVLSGSIKINPWSVEEAAKALEQAATMTLEERTARCFRDLTFVEKNSVKTWARCVLRDLAAGSELARKGREASLLSYGLGVGMRAVGLGEGKLQRLDMNQLCGSFNAAKGIRLLALDYSGTLVATTPADVFLKSGGQARAWHYGKEAQGAEHMKNQGGSLETRDPVSPEVLDSLKKLTADPRNRVVVMSMDLREELLHALKDIPNVILVAENGYATYLNQQWRQLVEEDDTGGDWYGGQAEESGMDTWQNDVKSVIDVYVERTSGAFTFTAPSSVTFNYLLADPELGEHQSKSLALQLETRIAGLPLVLELGKGTVTVRNRAVNRGAVLSQLIKLLPEPCDFLACFGDDIEDELMFRAALESKIQSVYTCRVGLKGASEETRAKYYLDDESDVAELLEVLLEGGDMHTGAPNMPTALSSTNRNSFAMLPGGFVTKKSLLSLSAIAESGEGENTGKNSPGLRPKKPSSDLNLSGLPHTPSMGTFDDLPPAPSSIPVTISRIESQEEDRPKKLEKRLTPSPPAQVNTILKKPSNSKSIVTNSATTSTVPSPTPSPSPIAVSTGRTVERQQDRPRERTPGQANAELARLIGAAIGGAVIASGIFLLSSSLFGRKKAS